MKLVFLICGVALFVYPFISDINAPAAIVFMVLGAACLSALDDKSKAGYTVIRIRRFFKINR